MRYIFCFLLIAYMAGIGGAVTASALEAPPVISSDNVHVTEGVHQAPHIPDGKKSGDLFNINIDLGDDREGMSKAIKILLTLTVLSVAPAFLIMMTSFTRVIIVLGFVRRALGTNTLPPNQAVLGLALFLTMFIMAPTMETMYDYAYAPYIAEEISEDVALQRAEDTIRAFLAKHTRKNDLSMFINISGGERPNTIQDVPLTTLIPAFITSELKTAFQMGFILFLPFVIIDLVIAAVLMALGMMMLPPVMISLPFKILLFVLIDGWALITHSIVASYG